MRWVFLLLGVAFMLGLGVAVGQRLDEAVLPLVLGVLAGIGVSLPTGLIVAGFAVHTMQVTPVESEEELPTAEEPALPDPTPPCAAWEHALREQVAAERAALAQVMQEHAYEQAQMNPRSDPRIVLGTPPAPYVAAGHTAPQGLYPPPARRFTVIGGAETANDEHAIA